MKPYNFYKMIISRTNEIHNQKFLGGKLAVAKKVLAHLSAFNWTDDDIIISVSKMCDTLIRSNRPCSFAYICGILLKTTSRPFNKALSVEMDSQYADWAEKEIQKLRGER